MADIKDVINTLDEAIDGFEKVVGASQAEMYKELLVLMKDLETSNGHVKQTIHNLKLLTAIKAKLGKIANNDKYISGVEKLIGYFDKLQGQQNDYFSRNFAEQTLGMEAKKKHDIMKQMAVQNTINALTDDGLKAGVTDKINDILLRAVTTGAKFGDLQEELRAHMLGKEGGQGALARYATTYATTSISQFTGQNNKLLTQDLGMQWFMYVGSNIETTREFCQHLTKKRYIHISEIPTIISGNIDGHKCAIYDKTKLPYGMIEGTNEENFQVNCGGWNCRHQLVPVHRMAVPGDIRARFEDAVGYIDESNRNETIDKIEGVKLGDVKGLSYFKKHPINPDFNTGAFEKTNNCQNCAVASEYAIRGYNVVAMPMYKEDLKKLTFAGTTYKQWINKETGKEVAHTFVSKISEEYAIEKINQLTKTPGRYHIGIQRKGGSNHVIEAIRYKDGNIVFFDFQSGDVLDIKKHVKSAIYRDGLCVYRVDNCEALDDVIIRSVRSDPEVRK